MAKENDVRLRDLKTALNFVVERAEPIIKEKFPDVNTALPVEGFNTVMEKEINSSQKDKKTPNFIDYMTRIQSDQSLFAEDDGLGTLPLVAFLSMMLFNDQIFPGEDTHEMNNLLNSLIVENLFYTPYTQWTDLLWQLGELVGCVLGLPILAIAILIATGIAMICCAGLMLLSIPSLNVGGFGVGVSGLIGAPLLAAIFLLCMAVLPVFVLAQISGSVIATCLLDETIDNQRAKEALVSIADHLSPRQLPLVQTPYGQFVFPHSFFKSAKPTSAVDDRSQYQSPGMVFQL